MTQVPPVNVPAGDDTDDELEEDPTAGPSASQHGGDAGTNPFPFSPARSEAAQNMGPEAMMIMMQQMTQAAAAASQAAVAAVSALSRGCARAGLNHFWVFRCQQDTQAP